MEIELIVALVVAIPVILFPAVFVWYLNLGGVVAAVRAVVAKRFHVQKRRAVARF